MALPSASGKSARREGLCMPKDDSIPPQPAIHYQALKPSIILFSTLTLWSKPKNEKQYLTIEKHRCYRIKMYIYEYI